MIAVLLTEGENAADVKAPVPAAKVPSPSPLPRRERGAAAASAASGSAVISGKPQTISPPKAEVGAKAPGEAALAKSSGARIFASPLARRLAKEAQYRRVGDHRQRPHGRVVKSDVEAVKSGKSQLKAPAAAPASAPSGAGLPLGMSKAQVMALYPEGSYDIVPNDGMRKVVAARLTDPSRPCRIST